jgi:hypothetical protein
MVLLVKRDAVIFLIRRVALSHPQKRTAWLYGIGHKRRFSVLCHRHSLIYPNLPGKLPRQS